MGLEWYFKNASDSRSVDTGNATNCKEFKKRSSLILR